MDIENKSICSKCGGVCCKKSGCDYASYDFKDLSFNGLLSTLEEGNISVVAVLQFEKLKTGKLFVNPFLYLRARNINRPIIDLLSMKTTCSQLTDRGCKYKLENRPTGGKNLIPKENLQCYPLVNQMDIINSWLSYQKTLAKIVKRMSGISVSERLRLDTEQLILDILNNNFENVSPLEIKDILSLLPHLSNAYPEEYERVAKEYQKQHILNKKTILHP